METGSQDVLRAYEVDRFETRQARQQIEIGDVETIGIGNPIRDGDDDVAHGIARGFVHREPFPQCVLVARASLGHGAFVFAKDGGEKPRLREQPLGAAVGRCARQRIHDELLESLDLL